MPLFFLSPIFKFLVVPALIALFLGGAYAWITTGAYNRGHTAGVAETTAHMKAAIAKQKAETLRDIERLKTLDRPALEKELEKKCREAGGGDACK